MTPFPYAIDVDASLAQAQEMMTEHAIRHLPVTQEGQLAGVVTDRDISHHLRHERVSESAQGDLRVRDVYVSEPYVADLNERLDTVLLQMAARHIGSALVVRRGKLAGIFTAIDACRGFGLYLCAHLPPTPDNEAASVPDTFFSLDSDMELNRYPLTVRANLEVNCRCAQLWV